MAQVWRAGGGDARNKPESPARRSDAVFGEQRDISSQIPDGAADERPAASGDAAAVSMLPSPMGRGCRQQHLSSSVATCGPPHGWSTHTGLGSAPTSSTRETPCHLHVDDQDTGPARTTHLGLLPVSNISRLPGSASAGHPRSRRPGRGIGAGEGLLARQRRRCSALLSESPLSSAPSPTRSRAPWCGLLPCASPEARRH